MKTYAKLLRDHPQFSRLSGRTLNRLTAHSAVVEYPKGSVVVKEGDPGDALYVVLSGRCQSTMLLPDGSDQILDIFAPGDTFGERALLGKDNSWKTIRVITDCVLLRIDGEEVLSLMEKDAKLEKELESSMHDKLRSLRKEFMPEKLGRIVAFSTVTKGARAKVVPHNVAIAIRKETGRSVLYVEVSHGSYGPALADLEKVRSNYFDDLRSAGQVIKGESGVWELKINVKGDKDEGKNVAPLLSHLARHARYVVLFLHPHLGGSIATEFMIQSDLAYALLSQTSDDVYKGNLLIRHLREHPRGELSSILPLICLEFEERALPYESLEKQLGTPVHGFIHGLPPSAGDTHSHYFHSEHGRFSSHIRYIAREIGRSRIGLALSPGGAKAFAHIGVIQVLEEHGIDVDVIAGVSMGGLVGALWAYGLSGKEMEEVARKLEKPWNNLRLFDPVFPPRRGFMKGNAVKRFAKEAIGSAHFSDMRRQLRIIATDLDTLESVVFDRGNVLPRIHASMAMPGVVVPVEVEGRTYVDGGIADPIPIDVLVRMGVERIIVVNTIPTPEEMKYHVQMEGRNGDRKVKWSFFSHINKYLNAFAGGNILEIWIKSMHGAESRVAEGACKQADVVIRPVICDSKWHDFGNAGTYIELGRKMAEEKLDELLALAK